MIDVPDTLERTVREDDEGEKYEKQKTFWYCVSLFIPDKNPLAWLIIHFGILFLYFILYLDLKENDNTVNGAILSIIFVCIVNYTLLIAFLLLRLIIVKGILERLVSRSALLFSLLKMLDPFLVYVIWATVQMLLWQSFIYKNSGNETFSIYFFGKIGLKYLTFHKSSLKWITITIYIYPILAIRTMCLSVIRFLFEADMMMVGKELLEKYVHMYNRIRKLNHAWLKYVLSKPDVFKMLEEGAKSNRMVCSSILEHINVKRKNSKEFFSNYKRVDNNSEEYSFDTETDGFADEWNSFSKLFLNSKHTTKVQNWFMSYHVNETAPIIHLLHQDVELRGNDAIFAAFDSFFNQIYITTTNPKANKSENEENPQYSSQIMQLKEQVTRKVLANAVKQSSIKLEMPVADESHVKGKRENFYMWCLKYMRKILGFTNREREMIRLSEQLNTISFQFKELVHSRFSSKDNDIFLCSSNFEAFLSKEEAREMIYWFDCSGHSKIDIRMFSRKLYRLISLRKKLKHSMRGQKSVFKVMSRLISACLWILTGITIAVICDVTIEVIVASGAGLLSAMTVALSYLYTNFITSVIFVAVSNPYNVDDRIRLNDGEPLLVRNIRTYSTEFVSLHGKVMIIQNSVLAGMKITNESRATNAIFEIPIKIDFSTSQEALNALEQSIKEYVNSHPSDFVKDFVYIFANDLHPGYYYEIAIWIKCVEGWGNWQIIYTLRTNFIEFMLRRCKELSISYKMPEQKIIFPGSLAIANFDAITTSSLQLPSIPSSLPMKMDLNPNKCI